MRPSAITLDLACRTSTASSCSTRCGTIDVDIPVHVISGGAGRACADHRRLQFRKPTATGCDLFREIAELAKTASKKSKALTGGPAKPKREAIPEIAGSRILIIDDDIRNIYSPTSVLEVHGVEVLHASARRGHRSCRAECRRRPGRHHDARDGWL